LVFEDSRKTDKFGIPVTMFGEVPEIFYKMFGRVTKLAAMIDIRMLELLKRSMTIRNPPSPAFMALRWKSG